jgi:hypothetical protein
MFYSQDVIENIGAKGGVFLLVVVVKKLITIKFQI